MRRNQAISAAMLFLLIGGSAVAQAQGKQDKGPKAPHAEKGKPAPAPKAEKVKPAPVQHIAKPAPVPHTEKSVRVQHVKAAQVSHAPKPAPALRVQKAAPVPRAPKAAFVPRADQDKRIKEQQKRAVEYRSWLVKQTKLTQKQDAQLQKQNRKAQLRYWQQYQARLAEQQRQLQAARDYSRDPYFSAPYIYRYNALGSTRYTNQYGADVLKQSVDYGYQQGYQAGQADRQDGWAANYQNSYAYSDANYGYTGNYVSQSDYNYYFRQGFQRGYNDGYYSRSQYGTSLNGTPSILSTVLSAILGLTSLR